MAKEKKTTAPKRTTRVTTDDGVKTDDIVTMGSEVQEDVVSTSDGVIVDDEDSDRGAAVARRAYELYAARGYEDGHDLEDWLTAEREV